MIHIKKNLNSLQDEKRLQYSGMIGVSRILLPDCTAIQARLIATNSKKIFHSRLLKKHPIISLYLPVINTFPRSFWQSDQRF